MAQLTSHHQLTDLELASTDAFPYLLIDGVKMEPALKWIYQAIDNPEWYPLYRNTRYRDVIDLSPCLVRIPADADVANQFESELGPQGNAIWLSSVLDIETLGHLLSQLLWVTTEDGRYLHYRFYDPVSLSRLMPELRPEERSALYRGVERLIWFDAKQTLWQQLTIPHSEENLPRPGGVIFKNQWVSVVTTDD